jgi:thymidylate synthase
MTIRIEDWAMEPAVHRGFTCSPADLIEYCDEILNGTERGWEYNYHDRIMAWGKNNVNQYDYAIHCLARKPTSNKAVISLPEVDTDAVKDGDGTHIPCLRQIKWELRQESEMLRLDTCLHWRARDAINAAPLNLYGLLQLAKRAAYDIADIIDKDVAVGSCIDVSEHYHVNGAHMELARKVNTLSTRATTEKTWHSRDLLDMYGD